MDSTVMQNRLNQCPTCGNPGHNPGGNGSLFGLWSLVAVGSLAAGTYHGYKRSRGSVGWTLGWSALSAFVPVIAIPVAIAQGFGKPKKKR